MPENAVDAYKNAEVWKNFFDNGGGVQTIFDDMMKNSDTVIYDISGRVVGRGSLPSVAGIYIINGRKVVVKP